MMIKNKLFVFWMFAISLLLCMTSCEDWLDVKPKSDVSKGEIFSNEQGFRDVLRGVYSKMGKQESYGYDITMKMMDVFAQYYDVDINHTCYKLNEFKYDEPSAVSFFNNVWNGHYNKIACCNLILENLKVADTALFTNDNYKLIKGEALGLRAFLHLDLLRMFAPSYKEGADKKAIPYITEFNMAIVKSSTVEETINKIIKDFTEAGLLLADSDPILKEGTRAFHHWVVSTNDDPFLDIRATRMNYYAVNGLLGRVYMLKDDYVNAKKHLEVVLKEGVPFELSTFVADHSSYQEIVFGLKIGSEAMENIYKISTEKKIRRGAIQDYLTINSSTFESIYDNPDDYRALNFIGQNITLQTISLKYDGYNLPGFGGGKVPLLKLAELRYYLAEILFDTDKTRALKLIEDILLHKGVNYSIDPDITREEFMEFIVRDARKEFIQEGQFFFFCKRLGINLKKDDTDLDMLDKYVFPMSDIESQFGNR